MTMGSSRAIVVGQQPIAGTRGGMRPILGTVESATSTGDVDSTNAFNPAKAQQDLFQAQTQTAHDNQCVLAYRDGLIERLPRAGGVRLAAMIADLNSRVVAGDPSVPAAVERLSAECANPGAGLPIGTDWHALILGGLRTLARRHTSVIDEIGAAGDGTLAVRRHEVFVPPQALIAMIKGLGLAEEFAPKP
jgi:hypothetical protein